MLTWLSHFGAMSSADQNRRPLKSRGRRWAVATGEFLAKVGVRPNQISVASIFFAAAAGGCFITVSNVSKPFAIIALIAAGIFIQLRLLCNLFDGMVAIEGGFQTKAGTVYNEFPDRFADAFILIGAGYVSRWRYSVVEIGWAAALFAVITAYIRALGVTAGASQQFCGPMAKPQRMALMSFAAGLSVIELLLNCSFKVMPLALVIISAGCMITIVRRTVRILGELNSK